MGGAAGTMARDAVTEIGELQVRVSIRGEANIFAATLPDKALKHSLLNMVIDPFLKSLARSGSGHKYSVTMLASVTVEGTPVGLNASSGLTIHSSIAAIYMQVAPGANASADPNGGPSKMTIELAMHQDEEKARPNFFVRMVSSLGGGGGSSNPAFKISLGGLSAATELSKKWMAKPARESLVLPFVEHLNAGGLGPTLHVTDIVGLLIEGVVTPRGADALSAAPRDFVVASGGVTHVTCQLRDESMAAAYQPVSQGAGAPSGTLITSTYGGPTRAVAKATTAPHSPPTRAPGAQSRSPMVPEYSAPVARAQDNPLASILEQIRFQKE